MSFLVMRAFASFVARLLFIATLSLALSGCDDRTWVGGSGADSWSDFAGTPDDLAALKPPSASTVKKAQRHLAVLGYDPGRVDGVLGKKSRIALKHFQVDQEVVIDGHLTPRLMALLENASERANRHENLAGGFGGAPRTQGGAGPLYEICDAYVYTDGRVETVSRVGPEQTVWETADGSAYTAHKNFILPPISWVSGSATRENQIQPATGQKWPPATAQEVVFWVRSRAQKESLDEPRVWSAKWRCVSGGVAKVDATVGRFDAVVIECERANPDLGSWKKRTWYFVPEIGHYVRRSDVIHGTGRKVTVDLVAVRPGGTGWPPAARGGLGWAVQGVLESGNTDTTVEWSSSAVGAMFNIRLKGGATVSGRIDCRRYDIERVGADQVRRFPAIACKRPWQERWLIPGLDPGSLSPRLLLQP